MNRNVSRRLRWERWKRRHEGAWNFVTTPIIVLAVAIVLLIKATLPIWGPILHMIRKRRENDGNCIFIDVEDAALIGITEHPGWIGSFTRSQVAGAIPNGTRIVKAVVERGDKHPADTKGVVLGSILPPGVSRIGYFVEWECAPHVAMFVDDWKIKPL